MWSRTRLCRRTAVAALVVVVAAGCSDGGSESHASPHTTTATGKRSGSSTTEPSSSTTTTTTTVPDLTDPRSQPATTVPTSATGSTPCGARTGTITAGVLSSDLGPVPTGSYTVTHCRLSSTQPTWSAVTLTPRPGQSVTPLTVVMERIGSIWTLHSYSAGPTGCDAPPPVPAELRLGC